MSIYLRVQSPTPSSTFQTRVLVRHPQREAAIPLLSLLLEPRFSLVSGSWSISNLGTLQATGLFPQYNILTAFAPASMDIILFLLPLLRTSQDTGFNKLRCSELPRVADDVHRQCVHIDHPSLGWLALSGYDLSSLISASGHSRNCLLALQS